MIKRFRELIVRVPHLQEWERVLVRPLPEALLPVVVLCYAAAVVAAAELNLEAKEPGLQCLPSGRGTRSTYLMKVAGELRVSGVKPVSR